MNNLVILGAMQGAMFFSIIADMSSGPLAFDLSIEENNSSTPSLHKSSSGNGVVTSGC